MVFKCPAVETRGLERKAAISWGDINVDCFKV